MRKASKPYIPRIVCMGYKSFFDDYDEVDIHTLLEGIPSRVSLKFIAENIEKVLYSQSDTLTQKPLINEYCRYVSKDLKERIRKYMRSNPECMLYETYGCSLLYGLILQNYQPFDEGDDYDELCQDEYERIFKALTYCNQRWTDEQTNGFRNLNLAEMLMLVDIPIVEFKSYKDFKFQIYKIIPYFRFLETDPYYKQHVLPAFYEDKKVTSWKQYVGRIFNLYAQSLDSSELDVSRGTEEDYHFFEQYAANPKDAECANLWEGHNAINYLRNHFLYPIGEKKFALMNANFLVDKIYQGVKFDIYDSIQKHDVKNKKGKNYKDRPEYLSVIGTDFSESGLLHALMQKTFAGRYDALYTGPQLHNLGVEAEPDLYMRIGKSLFLFEFKDVNLGDPIKYSANLDLIKKGIIDRICLYTEKKKKGAGQLHNTIEEIVKHSMDAIDPEIKDVERIYPIVVTTDRAFSAIGVQALVIRENSKFPPAMFNGFVSIPIVVDFDTLIDMSYRLHNGTVQLEMLFQDYLFLCKSKVEPFSTYIRDKYKRKGAKAFTKEEVKYLYEEAIQ